MERNQQPAVREACERAAAACGRGSARGHEGSRGKGHESERGASGRWRAGMWGCVRASAACLAILVPMAMTACRSSEGAGVFVDPALIPMIPPESRMLAGIRLEKLRGTELYKKYRRELPLPLLDQFREKTGIDPERDVWEVLLAGSGTDVLLLVRGHFEVGEMQPKLNSLGLHRSSYRGRELAGDERYSITFLNPGVAAAGRAASLRAMIDRQDQHPAMPRALAAQVALVPKGAQLWLVESGGLPQLGVLGQRDDIASVVENFSRYVAGAVVAVEVSDGLAIKGQVECSSEEGVKRVKDTLRGVVGLARLTTKTDETDLLRLYDAIEVVADGNTVRIGARVSPDLLPKLFALVRGKAARSIPGMPAAE